MTNNEQLLYFFLDDNNIIINALVFENHDIDLLEQVKNYFGYKTYFSSLDFPKAGVGGDFYNGQAYPEKPYPSWIRNEELISWDPPVPYPTFDEENPKYYQWSEELLNWEEIQASE